MHTLGLGIQKNEGIHDAGEHKHVENIARHVRAHSQLLDSLHTEAEHSEQETDESRHEVPQRDQRRGDERKENRKGVCQQKAENVVHLCVTLRGNTRNKFHFSTETKI